MIINLEAVHTITELFLRKTSQISQQDIRNLPGANITLLGVQSWFYFNKLANILNQGLFSLGKGQKISNQDINFQTVVSNSSDSTEFTGGIKNLFKISQELWRLASVQRIQSYSIKEARAIADNLIEMINSQDFPDPESQSIKTNLIQVINEWLAIL